MYNKLTQKQENFTRLIFEGMNQRAAYIEVYHPEYAISSIDGAASRLANNVKVKARLDVLNKKADNPVILTVEQRKERLSYIANEDNEGKYGYQRQPNVSAIDLLNKMTPSAYAPVRVDLTEGLKDLLEELRAGLAQIEEGNGNGH